MQVDPSQQGKYVELLAETFPTLDSSVASPHPPIGVGKRRCDWYLFSLRADLGKRTI